MATKRSISIVGGAGHIGFPLGLIFGSKGFKISLIDKDIKNVKKINEGITPFMEENSKALLKKLIKNKIIFATNYLNNVKKSKFIIVCIGTPVGKNLKPMLKEFLNFSSKNLSKASFSDSFCRLVKKPKRPVLIPRMGISVSFTKGIDRNKVPSPPMENR